MKQVPNREREKRSTDRLVLGLERMIDILTNYFKENEVQLLKMAVLQFLINKNFKIGTNMIMNIEKLKVYCSLKDIKLE